MDMATNAINVVTNDFASPRPDSDSDLPSLELLEAIDRFQTLYVDATLKIRRTISHYLRKHENHCGTKNNADLPIVLFY